MTGHIVQQIVENMPGVHCDLIEIRYDSVDPERLVPELAFLHYRGNCLRSGTFPMIEYQIGRIHVPMFPVRSSDLIPGTAGLGDHLNG